MMTPAEVVASLAELKAAGKSPIRPPGHWRTWPVEPAHHWAAGTKAYNEAQAQHTQPVPGAFNYSGLQHVLLVSFRTVYHDYDFHNRVSCYSSCSCSSSIVVLGSRGSRSSSDAASFSSSILSLHCRASGVSSRYSPSMCDIASAALIAAVPAITAGEFLCLPELFRLRPLDLSVGASIELHAGQLRNDRQQEHIRHTIEDRHGNIRRCQDRIDILRLSFGHVHEGWHSASASVASSRGSSAAGSLASGSSPPSTEPRTPLHDRSVTNATVFNINLQDEDE